MEFEKIGIALTDKCNAHCEMCCSGMKSCQGSLKTISEDELDLILSQIRDCPSITQVGITGGEPMLYPYLVEKIFQYDFGREVKFGLKTNGFWGRNPDQACEFIARNHQLLANLSFSYDEFHCRYISLDSIKAIIDIAADFKIPTEIVGCFLRGGATPGEILDELGEYAYKTEFKYQPVIRTGLAEGLEKESFIPLYRSNDEELPCTALRQGSPLITTSLDLYPCCSQVVQNTILRVGNLAEKPLSELLGSISCNRLFVKMFTEGLVPLLRLAGASQACPETMSAPCEACGFLFSDSRYLGTLRNALANDCA